MPSHRRYCAALRDTRRAFDEVARAEVALLNLEELHHAPNLMAALRRVETARQILMQGGDLSTAEQQLAERRRQISTWPLLWACLDNRRGLRRGRQLELSFMTRVVMRDRPRDNSGVRSKRGCAEGGYQRRSGREIRLRATI